jgi:hypothetical protein
MIKKKKPHILPLPSNLPRPSLLLSTPPLHVRLIENFSKNSQSFRLEGFPPIIDLIESYLTKHATESYRLELYKTAVMWGENLSCLICQSSGAYSSALVVSVLLENSLGFDRIGMPIAVGNEIVSLFRRDEELLVL